MKDSRQKIIGNSSIRYIGIGALRSRSAGMTSARNGRLAKTSSMPKGCANAISDRPTDTSMRSLTRSPRRRLKVPNAVSHSPQWIIMKPMPSVAARRKTD